MLQMLQIGCLLFSLHDNRMPAEDLPVHPSQGKLGILMPREDNVQGTPSARAIYVAFFTWGSATSHSQ